VLLGTSFVVGHPAIAQPKQTQPAAKPSQSNGKAAKPAAPAALPVPASEYRPVQPLELLKSPASFVNHYVTFNATFNSFSSLGLDYKRVLRDSKDYVSVLIRRPDVPHHDIPLSELKLFLPRSKSESVMELEAGDQVSVKGKVFAVALGEPWMDIDQISVLKKAKPSQKAGETTAPTSKNAPGGSAKPNTGKP
jgi:hypothetical protein